MADQIDGAAALQEATSSLPESQLQDPQWIEDGIEFFSNLGTTVSNKFREIAENIVHEGSTAIMGATDNGTRLPEMNEIVDGIQNKTEEITGIEGIGELDPSTENLPNPENTQTPAEPNFPAESSETQLVPDNSQIDTSDIGSTPSLSPDANVSIDGSQIPDADISQLTNSSNIFDWLANNGIFGMMNGNCSLSDVAGVAFVSLVFVLIIVAIFSGIGNALRYMSMKLSKKFLPDNFSLLPFWITYPGFLVKNILQLITAFLTGCRINRVSLLPFALTDKFLDDGEKKTREDEKKALAKDKHLGYIAYTCSSKHPKVKNFQEASCASFPAIIGTLLSMLLIWCGIYYTFPWYGWILSIYTVICLCLNCAMSISDLKALWKSPLTIIVILFAIFMFFPLDTTSLTSVL